MSSSTHSSAGQLAPRATLAEDEVPAGLPSPTKSREWPTRLATTLAGWMVAFVLVLALLSAFGHQLDSLPYALNALVFTGILVPIMGTVVMPTLSAAVARRMGPPPSVGATHQATNRSRPEPAETTETWRDVSGVTAYDLKPIGRVESPLTARETAPKQGAEKDHPTPASCSTRPWPTASVTFIPGSTSSC